MTLSEDEILKLKELIIQKKVGIENSINSLVTASLVFIVIVLATAIAFLLSIEDIKLLFTINIGVPFVILILEVVLAVSIIYTIEIVTRTQQYNYLLISYLIALLQEKKIINEKEIPMAIREYLEKLKKEALNR